MNNEVSKYLIGVHSLSEFVFCPRAGLISFGQQTDDTGTDGWTPDLSYSPPYDMLAIEPQITELRNEQQAIGLGMAVGVAFLVMLYLFVKPFVTLLFFIVAVPIALFFLNRLVRIQLRVLQLSKTLAEYRNAERIQPKLENPELEEVPWLSLMRAGDLERCHDPFIDEELGLAGQPWKLFRSGKLCLPVFKCKMPKPRLADGGDKAINLLYRQHYVRMAAYCELIQRCTGHLSPAGIILFAGTYRAVVVKVDADPKIKEELQLAIESAHETISIFKAKHCVEQPDENICSGCPHGFPRRFNYASTSILKDGTPVPTKLHVIGEKTVHSRCGDFFKWVPPHKQAYEYQLRRN